jgi:hypothetical protein
MFETKTAVLAWVQQREELFRFCFPWVLIGVIIRDSHRARSLWLCAGQQASTPFSRPGS